MQPPCWLQGLILVNGTSGLTTILAKRVSLSAAKTPGSEIIFADDLDVASDGTVYFSTLTDVPPIPGPTNEHDALRPCVLNLMQVTLMAMHECLATAYMVFYQHMLLCMCCLCK